MRTWWVAVVSVVVASLGCGSRSENAPPPPTKSEAQSYIDRSKSAEAELQLGAIGKALKTEFAMNAAFPTGAAPLTPATACCAGPKHRCPPEPAAWQPEPWAALDFSLDAPHYFQYSFQSDGQKATAIAHGDLDCDGQGIDFVLTCTSVGGNPSCDLAPPTTAD